MDWEPHTVVDEALVDPAPVAALQVLLDDGLPPVGPGDPLPPLWHWVALPRWSPSSLLGLDGHPARGGFLPPVELPRRMFAGGEVTVHGPVRVGDVVRREAAVTSVEHKHGRSGELVVVTVVTRHFRGDVLAVEETQDLIYRGAGGRSAPEPVRELAPAPPLARTGEWTWALRTDPSLLMRFSAATANAHRIHYDHPYATQVEGYPGLVVHGPLMTILLAEVARLEGVSGVTRLTHRNLAPLFCGAPATLRRTAVDGAATTFQLVSPAQGEETPRTTLTLWVDETRVEKGNDR
ncbi:MaoC family dehydratase N-terminal domain-containing protein [Nocardioides sp. DS6]|uniref:MaoC family dehydratase N-terminal domain-containing protein n=1 Tax=Nocardioides eburneus TaxID=3231482 RepID=A0ABV3STQ9_9ACTN